MAWTIVGWVLALISVLLPTHAVFEWLLARRSLDLAFVCASLPWLVLSLITLPVGQAPLVPWPSPAGLAVYQLMLAGIAGFLFLSLDLGRRPWLALLVPYVLIGLMLALRAADSSLWAGFNIGAACLAVVWLGRAAWRYHLGTVRIVLVLALFGLGVMVNDLAPLPDNRLHASIGHLFYFLALSVWWKGSVWRATVRAEMATAAQHGRTRLAQELHDGVGAQLSTVIVALKAGGAREREAAAALQLSLIELKLVALDCMDDSASVVALLASLRYRTQPLLDAAGIELQWDMADAPALEHVQGETARHVLRIAQECLANAVRHSHASRVRLSLRPLGVPAALRLEVEDNGVGWAPDPSAPPAAEGGHGLRNMRQRTAQLGGELCIGAGAVPGTRVTLTVPLC